MAEEELTDDRSLDQAMEETIRESLKEINAREPEADPDAAAEEPAAPDAKTDAERARDEAGKFKKADKESAAPAKADTPEKPLAAPAPEQAAAEPAADKPLVTTKGQPIDLARPPSSWKPAAKAAWGTLPEPLRAEIHRREAEYHHGYGDIKENADFGRTIKSVVEPYRALIMAEGGTAEKAIADTMRTAALFRTGNQQAKLQAIFQLDQQFGAGLREHFAREVQAEVAKRTGSAAPAEGAQPAAQQPQQFVDPRVDTILASLQEQENQRAALERERQAQGAAASNKAVEDFIGAKDASGAPLYPFVDNVLSDMSERVALIRRANPGMENAEALKQAYEQAVWANPETRDVLLAAKQAQAAQPAESQQRVAAAKRASASNVPKRGALPATGPALNLDETIRETGRALGMF